MDNKPRGKVVLYAINASEAERARRRSRSRDTNTSRSSKGSLTPNSDLFELEDENVPMRTLNVEGTHGEGAGLERDRDREPKRNKTIEFRQDARIWWLYLEEAECEAKERAELWRTGLDSLLIFAGLFAGIVSSFVIDARGDIQPQSEQHILGDILDAVRGGSVNEPLNVQTSSKWTNGLWILSLYITLFSAIMGVLAKAWLANFFPATTRREAKDAYHRYKLDKQAKDWYLKEVITLVPLLVQIASFLFLIGLIIQSREDNNTLGHTLMIFCISGAVVYATMTILPLCVPSSPFHTPLSDLLLWLKDFLVSLYYQRPLKSGSPGSVKTDINEGLAEIMYSKLIKSPKPAHVDYAIAEIASPAFKKKWVDHFCRNDTPEVLLLRLKSSATTRGDDMGQRIDALCNHLLAFLRFVDHYEDILTASKTDVKVFSSLEKYMLLNKVLHRSLEAGNPLHRWNNLPEPLRPLLFGLRTQILSSLPPPPSQVDDPPILPDFNPDELSDRPWEMAFKNIQSSHRLHFTLAASRGLVQGQHNLQTISAFILSLCLAKAASVATETGRTSEWDGGFGPDARRNVDILALKYLSELYNVTVSRWEDIRESQHW